MEDNIVLAAAIIIYIYITILVEDDIVLAAAIIIYIYI